MKDLLWQLFVCLDTGLMNCIVYDENCDVSYDAETGQVFIELDGVKYEVVLKRV